MTRPWLALNTTLLVQMLASLALTAPSVLAPVVAPMLGFAPERIGAFVSVAYLAAMAFGLRSGLWVDRIGAVRLSQCALLACAAGVLVALAGHVSLLVLGALLLGAGYGVINPAAASLLGRHAPTTARGLFFSIKQTGVPIGVALAGLLMPLGLYTIGWRATGVGVALACGLVAVLLVPLVRRLESPTAATAPASAPPSAGPLRTVLRDPALLRLSLVSLAFGMTQLTFLTFLVSLLHLDLHLSLALAAGVLATSQAVSTVSRIVMGHVADRWIGPGRLLGLLGLAMSAACVGLAWLGPDTGIGWVFAAALASAATAMGWNGVFFAELARLVPHEQMAKVSGATQVFTFGGGMCGPFLFGEFVRLGGSYSLAYAVLAALPALAGLAMLHAARRETGAATTG